MYYIVTISTSLGSTCKCIYGNKYMNEFICHWWHQERTVTKYCHIYLWSICVLLCLALLSCHLYYSSGTQVVQARSLYLWVEEADCRYGLVGFFPHSIHTFRLSLVPDAREVLPVVEELELLHVKCQST